MTSKKLELISDLLSNLHGHAYFRPEHGPLRERLTEVVLDAVEGEVAEELSEGFDLEVSVGRQDGDGEVMVTFSIDLPGVVQQGEIAVSGLTAVELEDLSGYLERLSSAAGPAEPEVKGKNVIRKKPEGDHHLKEAASARLKVSPEWLKSVIPCTDYSYDEIDGKKYIRDYYWSKDLIERLFKIKNSKATPEDLQYVAKECCEGDADWAKDLIARLKSPNRPEPAPREQGQKGQGRQAQQQGQGRQGQSQAQGQGQGQGKQAQNAGKQVQAKAAVPGERSRQRPRNKRPFKGQGKEGGPKGENAGQQQKPQQNQ
jgi:hypothetical protein